MHRVQHTVCHTVNMRKLMVLRIFFIKKLFVWVLHGSFCLVGSKFPDHPPLICCKMAFYSKYMLFFAFFIVGP